MDCHKQTLLFIVMISSWAGMVYSCACSKNIKRCANIYQVPVDFQTAQQNCRERGAQLLIQSNATKEVVAYLLNNLIGHFWTGLQFQNEKCLGNTSTLRAGERNSNLETEETSCVSLCVSVSSDGIQTPRPCTDKLNGYLCEDSKVDICEGRAPVILDNTLCMFGPCEHKCTPLEIHGGYKCSCLERYRPNARDPRRCDFYCATRACEAICLRSGSACWCPNGFVRSDRTCEDIDECESNHGCAHKCLNTIGTYRCACYEPFTLVNKTECALAYNEVFTTPYPNYIARGALTTPGEYAGMIIFLVMAVFALLVLVHYLRSRRTTVQECNPPNYEEFQETVSKEISAT